LAEILQLEIRVLDFIYMIRYQFDPDDIWYQFDWFCYILFLVPE